MDGTNALRPFLAVLFVILCGTSVYSGEPFPPLASEAALKKAKDSFAELMAERAGLAARSRACTRIITASRRTVGASSAASSATAHAYRDAVKRVERALDQHPDVLLLEEEYAAEQERKIELSKEQGRVVGTLREARKALSLKKMAALAEAERRAGAERSEVLKRAEVKAVTELSEPDRDRMRQIHARFTNEVATIRRDFEQESAALMSGDEGLRHDLEIELEALNVQYAEIEASQAAIKSQVTRARERLRKSDPGIAQLSEQARSASRAHVASAEAKPEVIEAKAFLRNVAALRADIDQRARPLRKAILEVDPDYKTELDKQSAAAGLALVDEEFWRLNE